MPKEKYLYDPEYVPEDESDSWRSAREIANSYFQKKFALPDDEREQGITELRDLHRFGEFPEDAPVEQELRSVKKRPQFNTLKQQRIEALPGLEREEADDISLQPSLLQRIAGPIERAYKNAGFGQDAQPEIKPQPLLQPRRTQEGRQILNNPDGPISTEETITIDDPLNKGKYVNIPTIYGGKRVSTEKAVELYKKNRGMDQDTGLPFEAHETIDQAEKAAQARSNQLGQLYGQDPGIPVPTDLNITQQKIVEPSMQDKLLGLLPFGGHLQSQQEQDENASLSELSPAPRQPQELGSFQKGLGRGILNTGAQFMAGGAAVSKLMGADETAENWMKSYDALTKESEKFKGVQFGEAFDSPGKFVSWAAGLLGEQTPVIASMVVSGGIGSVMGKVAAKGLLPRGAQALSSEQAKKVAKWSLAGGAAGSRVGMSALESGGIYGEQREAGVEESPAIALIGGAINGALEMAVPLALWKILKAENLSGPFVNDLLKRLGTMGILQRIMATAGGTSIAEGLTELAQEEVAIQARALVDEKYDRLGKEANQRRIESGVSGATIGIPFGGIAGFNIPSQPAQDLPADDGLGPLPIPEAGLRRPTPLYNLGESLPPVNLPKTTNNLGLMEGQEQQPQVQGPPIAVPLEEEQVIPETILPAIPPQPPIAVEPKGEEQPEEEQVPQEPEPLPSIQEYDQPIGPQQEESPVLPDIQQPEPQQEQQVPEPAQAPTQEQAKEPEKKPEAKILETSHKPPKYYVEQKGGEYLKNPATNKPFFNSKEEANRAYIQKNPDRPSLIEQQEEPVLPDVQPVQSVQQEQNQPSIEAQKPETPYELQGSKELEDEVRGILGDKQDIPTPVEAVEESEGLPSHTMEVHKIDKPDMNYPWEWKAIATTKEGGFLAVDVGGDTKEEAQEKAINQLREKLERRKKNTQKEAVIPSVESTKEQAIPTPIEAASQPATLPKDFFSKRDAVLPSKPKVQESQEPFELTPEVTSTKKKERETDDQKEMFGTGETLQAGVSPIIGRETTPEESPLFSKTAQEWQPEQTVLPDIPPSDGQSKYEAVTKVGAKVKFFDGNETRGAEVKSLGSAYLNVLPDGGNSLYSIPVVNIQSMINAGRLDVAKENETPTPVEILGEDPKQAAIPTPDEVTGEKKDQDTVNQSIQLANDIKDLLKTNRPIGTELLDRADTYFGGTIGQGAYTAKDAYDAMELGINMYILENDETFNTHDNLNEAMGIANKLDVIIRNAMASQKLRRTEEQNEFQQFSTPPSLAYAMNWAANITDNDTVMEPSAGLGGLAVFARNAGARVVTNEFNERRSKLLKSLKLGSSYRENAEQLNNIIPKAVKPHVIIMNPPFSSTAGRIEGERSSKNVIPHLNQALARLLPGGRLVALIGKGRVKDSQAVEGWIAETAKKNQFLARVSLPGSLYKAYGTTYDNQVLIFDKVPPTGEAPVIGEAESIADLLRKLQEVRHARKPITIPSGIREDREGPSQESGSQSGPIHKPTDNTPQVAGAKVQDEQPEPGRIPGSAGTVRGTSGQSPSVSKLPDQGPNDRKAEPNAPSSQKPKETGEPIGSRNPPPRTPGQSDGQRTAGDGDVGESVTIKLSKQPKLSETTAVDPERDGEASNAVYQTYRPAKVSIAGAKPHPGKLVETAAMSAVDPPDATYEPHIQKKLIESGAFSLPQIETIVYAGQAHSKTLPSGERRGLFNGDGTGVGKAREIIGVILDNFAQGRKKAVWLSANKDLQVDAAKEWKALGQPDNLLFGAPTSPNSSIDAKEGVMFSTYATLAAGLSLDAQQLKPRVKTDKGTGAQTESKPRLDQLLKWVGPDFDGVIAFDESHLISNLGGEEGPRGKKIASLRALVVDKLQKTLPQARIVYFSATGATNPENLSYMQRLGLWGAETAFPSVEKFVSSIKSGGIAAMEVVARDMKAMGAYLSRTLDYRDVTFSKLEHALTPEQEKIYNEIAKMWQIVLNNVDAALDMSGGNHNGQAKANAYGRFWSSQLAFFNQTLTALQMPSVLKDIQDQIDAGHSVVLQVVDTNEELQKRQLGRMEQEEGDLESLDLTPRETLRQYLSNGFPTQAFETYKDENGKLQSRLVVDSSGRPVQNADAVEKRDEMLARLEEMKVPDSPLDAILSHFGPDHVAEITGRKERVFSNTDEDGNRTMVRERSRGNKARQSDADDFMAGRKRILIFSRKGGTGRSYHADLKAKNQQKRIHYVLQAGWSADQAVQGFGRTHRTNQKQAPHFTLVHTNLKGHKRFLSSIARRLAQLGALTKGQREAGGQGMFSESDNLESPYSAGALTSFFQDLYYKQIDGLSWDVTERMGLRGLVDEKTGSLNVTAIPPITKFLNRLLSLEIHEQNEVFDAFFFRMERAIDVARTNGTLDTGMENYKAEAIRLIQSQKVFKDDRSTAETKYMKFEADHRLKTVSSDEVVQRTGFSGFYRNKDTNNLRAAVSPRNFTNEKGQVITEYRMLSVQAGKYTYVKQDNLRNNWKSVTKEEGKKDWDAEVEKTPSVFTESVHLISGAILPIWDRLPQGHSRVMRLTTDEGETYLGRVIESKDVPVVLSKLNAGQNEVSPQDIVKFVMEEKSRVTLANGWTISRRVVGGEPRMELESGSSTSLYDARQILKGFGVFTENIQYKNRYFIPVGTSGEKVIAAVIKHSPVAEIDGNKISAPTELTIEQQLQERAMKASGSDERGAVGALPAKGPQDVIVGLGDDGKFHSLNEEVDARVQEAKKGLKKQTWKEWWSEYKPSIWNRISREFEFLPDDAYFSRVRHSLLQLQKHKGVAAERTYRNLQGLVGDLGHRQYDLFEWKALLADLQHEAENDADLPFGYTKESVEVDLAEVDRLLKANPHLQQRWEERDQLWNVVKGRYQTAMDSIGFDVSRKLKKVDYFRHQVLEHARTRAVTGSGGRLRTPTGRGFLKERHGSTLDINANYIQAEFEVMAQMDFDTQVAKVIHLVGQQEEQGGYNIQERLVRDARAMNDASIRKMIAKEKAAGLDPSPTEESMKQFAKKIAINLSMLRGALDLHKDDPLSLEDIAAIANDPNADGHGPALGVFKNINARKQFVREQLGENYKTWEMIVPEGYTLWQPREGNILYLADTIPHYLAKTIQEKLLDDIGLQPEQVRQVMAMGGKREQFVVREEVANQLNELQRPLPTGLEILSQKALGSWKQLMLIAPRRFVKYNLRNTTGDLDAIFAGNPSAIKWGWTAVKDLHPYFFKDQPMFGEVKEWFERGGFGSTLQVQEMGDLNDIELFRSSLEKKWKETKVSSLPLKLFSEYWKKARLATDYREAIMRYAAYRDYLDHMQKDPDGRPHNFGASIPENVMALPDIRDRAYKLANEVLGAYDRIGVAGQHLRRHWIPFWSWQEVNFRRYRQMAKNAWSETDNEAIARIGSVAAKKTTLSGLKFLFRLTAMWALLQLWNNLFFPDEEKELNNYTRNRPHIIFGRNSKGEIIHFSGLGAFGDILSWFGLDAFPNLIGEVQAGRRSIGEIVKDSLKQPVNKVVQSLTPFLKMPAEMIARHSTFPDAFSPRPIQDRAEYLARQFTLDNEYKVLTGKPSVPYVGQESIADLFVYRQDPGAAAYGDWYAIEDKWKTRWGKERHSFFRDDKSKALRNWGEAMRLKDGIAAKQWKKAYYDAGGNDKSLEQSIARLAPLHGLKISEREEVLKSLDGSERDILARAEAYWYERLSLPLNSYSREKLRSKLKSQGWLTGMRPSHRDSFPLPVPGED